MNRIVQMAVIGAVVGLSTASALAQWSTGSTNTLKVGDLPGDNSGARMVATSDGGCYIAWQAWTTGSPGYETRVQRLNSAGVEQWPHNGIQITPGAITFTVVGGLDIALAPDGGLFVTTDYPSDPANPQVRQANVQKLSTAGVKQWGSGGNPVSLSTGPWGGTPCHVCPMPDGGCVVGYTSFPPSGSGSAFITLMRVNSSGGNAWANPQYIFEGGSPLILCDLQPSTGDSFIALWLKSQNQSALITQKFTGTGVPAAGWPTPKILDAFGLTSRDFPTFITDGAGGAIYGWRSYANNGFASPSEALLQHILSDGTLKFPTPLGMVNPAFVDASVGRHTASVAYNQAEGSYFLVGEQGPNSNGVSRTTLVQKFSSAGARLFNEAAFTVIPEAANQQITPGDSRVVATSDGGCMVFGTVVRGFSTTQRVIHGTKVSLVGGFPEASWFKYINSDATTDKGRVQAINSAGSDDAIVVFGWGGGLGARVAAARVDAATGAPGAMPVPPSIDVDLPEVVTACDGATVTLSVSVSGTPNISYSWQRHYASAASNPEAFWVLNDGDSSYQCVVPDDGTTYSGTHTSTLTINNVHALPPTITCNSGTVNTDPFNNTYRCIIFNAASDQPLYSGIVRIEIDNNCCPADFNHSGARTVQDIFDFLAAWFAQNPAADFNHSGSVSVQDIFDFLAAWFAGC